MECKRVLFKLSGESIGSALGSGIDHAACMEVARKLKEVHDLGIEAGVVIGGGNIFRGHQGKAFGFERTPSDHVGMLATAINGLLLGQALRALGCSVRVVSAIAIERVVEAYDWNACLQHLDKGTIVLFVGGTGNPYFTTDSAAAMRACEMNADILVKATKVDGVYDSDPVENKQAKRYERLSYNEVLERNLGVMDATAIALCRDGEIPIYVCNLDAESALIDAVYHHKGGTMVTE